MRDIRTVFSTLLTAVFECSPRAAGVQLLNAVMMRFANVGLILTSTLSVVVTADTRSGMGEVKRVVISSSSSLFASSSRTELRRNGCEGRQSVRFGSAVLWSYYHHHHDQNTFPVSSTRWTHPGISRSPRLRLDNPLQDLDRRKLAPQRSTPVDLHTRRLESSHLGPHLRVASRASKT